MSTTDTPSVDVEALRLYVDAIDAKPRHFAWSDNPVEGISEGPGTEWSYVEYRQPDEGDGADCEDCGEAITYVNDERGWVHSVSLDPDLIEAYESEDEAIGASEDGYDHDAEPDDDYRSGDSDGPMMNFWIPVHITDTQAAAKKIADLPLCVVTVGEETGLALTGGGMDLSWEICDAFVAIGHYPPFHYAGDLPRMAEVWNDRKELVAAVCRKSCEIMGQWAARGVERVDETVRWTKGREWNL